MMIPNEFLLKALKKEVTATIISAPIGKRVFRQSGTERIVADGNPAGMRKYGIVNVLGAKYKKIKDLTYEEIKDAGHQSIKDFTVWWSTRNPNYNPEDRVAIISFELVAIQLHGLRLMEGKIKAGDKRGKERPIYN